MWVLGLCNDVCVCSTQIVLYTSRVAHPGVNFYLKDDHYLVKSGSRGWISNSIYSRETGVGP